jgi:hypothetical protein
MLERRRGDWDANGAELLRNLQEVGRRVTVDAAARRAISSEVVRDWQALIMQGLEPTDGEPIGAYRGEAGLEDYHVEVAGHSGTPAERVAADLAQFDRTLAERLEELDRTIRHGHVDQDLSGATSGGIWWIPRAGAGYSQT